MNPGECIPCSLKSLAAYYWSATNMNDDGTPQHIPDDHPDLEPNHGLAYERWGREQGCPFEFIGMLLKCCDQQTCGVRIYTGPLSQPQMSAWYSQLAALFVKTFVEKQVCTRCNIIFLPPVPDEPPYLTRDRQQPQF